MSTFQKPYPIFYLCFLVLCIFACKQEKKNPLASYYFPVNELHQGLVYSYGPVSNDSFPPYYWLYKTVEDEAGIQYLTSTYYEYDFRIMQYSKEEIVDNGTIIRDYRLYEYDSTGIRLIAEPTIQANTGFPFQETEENGVYISSLKWIDIVDSLMEVTLVRNRQFDTFSNYIFEGKNHSVAVFKTQEQYRFDHKEEGYRAYNATVEEYYAKGIGLCYLKKSIDQGPTIEYDLKERFSMSELEKRFREADPKRFDTNY